VISLKDETKEILNKLEIVARKHTIEVCENGSKIETMPASVVDELRLNNYSSKLLLDYIINLEQENEKLKQEQIGKYQTLKELQQKADNQKEEIQRLYKQREKFMKKYRYLKEEKDKYKNVIDKIKEYIKEDKNCIPKHINDYILELLEEVE
jgi:peptidoglycan hydrolase CwlO-like protein